MIGACLICDSLTLSILHANEMASQLLEVPEEDLFGKDARQWLEPTVDEEGDCLDRWLKQMEDPRLELNIRLAHLSSPEGHYKVHLERLSSNNEPRILIQFWKASPQKPAAEGVSEWHYRSTVLDNLMTTGGGIAHDVNNMLTPLMMSVDLLQEGGPKAREKTLQQWESDLQKLASRLKAFFQFLKGSPQATPIQDLSAEIQSFLPLLESALRKNPHPSLQASSDIHACPLSVDQLHHLLLTTCQVIKNHSTKAREIQIMIGDFLLDESSLKTLGELPEHMKPGAYSSLTITDRDAKGDVSVSQSILPPPLVHAKDRSDKGSGLLILRDLVESLGGCVRGDIDQENGVVFTIILPRANTSADPAVTKSSAQTAETSTLPNTPTILYVEDEEPLRKIAGAVLKRAGYEVIFGVNGVEGLAKLTQEGKRLSLIITDIAMPEMDGIEFATLSRQLHPELPIIMVSGRFDDAVTEKLNGLGIEDRIHKPFTAAQIKQAVGKAVHRS